MTVPPKPGELSARSCLHKRKVGFWRAVAHFHAIYIITYFSQLKPPFGGAIWSCHHMCRFMYYREFEKKILTKYDWQETHLKLRLARNQSVCGLSAEEVFTTTSCTILQGTQQIILPVSHYSCWMMATCHITPNIVDWAIHKDAILYVWPPHLWISHSLGQHLIL